MARFMTTDIGMINLDHIIRIERGETVGEMDCLYTVTGEKLECRIGSMRLESVGTVIPAAPGTVATVVSVLDTFEKPVADNVIEEREPIVGWLDYGGYLEPMFLQTPPKHAVALLRVGDEYRELSYDGLRDVTIKGARTLALHNKTDEWWQSEEAKKARETSDA